MSTTYTTSVPVCDRRLDGLWQATFTVTDGTEVSAPYVVVFDGTQAALQAQVNAICASVNPLGSLQVTPGQPFTPSPPHAPPPAPNPLTVAAVLGLLSAASLAAVRNTMDGSLQALRADIENQNRPAVINWIALASAAGTAADGTTRSALITSAEATAVENYVTNTPAS